MSSAAIYQRGASLIIHPISKTIHGLGITSPPVEVLSRDISPEAFGDAILRAIEASRSGLPEPTDWSSVTGLLYRAVGVKSWSAFARNAVHCTVGQTEHGFIFTPSRKRKTGGAYEFLEPAQELPLGSSTEEIGLAAEKALDVSAAASQD